MVFLVFPFAAVAEDLTCVPDTMCIDKECQAGHDDRETITLRNWTLPRAVLHSAYGDVAVKRAKGADLLRWSGKNSQDQTETLNVRPSDLGFEYVVELDPNSGVEKITAKGGCKVTK